MVVDNRNKHVQVMVMFSTDQQDTVEFSSMYPRYVKENEEAT